MCQGWGPLTCHEQCSRAQRGGIGLISLLWVTSLWTQRGQWLEWAAEWDRAGARCWAAPPNQSGMSGMPLEPYGPAAPPLILDTPAGRFLPDGPLSPQHQEQHSEGRSAPSSEPHLIFVYEDRQILEDAAALISYYVKRQPAIQKEDQGTIHQLVHQFVPSLFFSQQLDLGASEDSADEGRGSPPGQSAEPAERKKPAPRPQSSPPEEKGAAGEPPAPEPAPPRHKPLDDVYSLFFANNNWYFFLRLHQTLCSRLLKIYRQAQKQLLEYRTEKEREKVLCEGRREKGNDPAMELRLKQPSEPRGPWGDGGGGCVPDPGAGLGSRSREAGAWPHVTTAPAPQARWSWRSTTRPSWTWCGACLRAASTPRSTKTPCVRCSPSTPTWASPWTSWCRASPDR